jgi:hypothetical protein
VEQLSRVSEDIQTIGNLELVACIRAELNIVGKLGVRLREFKSKKKIDELDIHAMAKRI